MQQSKEKRLVDQITYHFHGTTSWENLSQDQRTEIMDEYNILVDSIQ